jgi:S1-C subfamily serine protease
VKRLLLFPILLLTLGPLAAGTAPPPTIPSARPDPKAVNDFSRSLVRVNSTTQSYDFFRPWAKKNPVTRRGIGTVIGPNQVLVTAALIANHTFIEFERPATSERIPAEVIFVDYESNLALLAATDPAFLERAVPLALDETARVGSTAEILQLEPNGDIAPTTARLTTITMAQYVLDDVGFLIFRLSAPIQQREGSFVLPAVRDGRLLGLLMRYDNRNQTADVIPPVIINRFLEQAQKEEYAAFPRAGIGIAPLRDPQLRRYLDLDQEGGVLITKVDPRSSASAAGIQVDDVLVAIDDTPIDADGNFTHPEYGRIPLGFLITTQKLAGDVVKFHLIRDGEKLEVPVKLRRRDVPGMSVPSHLFDEQPTYLVRGGFVFLELNRAFLQEWGSDWRGNAPQRLVHADLFQDDLRPDGEKVVFLSTVLPTPATLGYENLSGLIVESVDGIPIHSLTDLDEVFRTAMVPIHRIEVSDDPRLIFLDRATADEVEPSIARQFGIPQLRFLQEEDSPSPTPSAPPVPAVEAETTLPTPEQEPPASAGESPPDPSAPPEVLSQD